MFTGIIQAVGRIVCFASPQGRSALQVDTGALDLSDVAIGDSIAVEGVCLTVVKLGDCRLQFDVSPATLEVTTGLAAAGEVNLEKSLRLADRLGGHLVLGHVDCVGYVARCEAIAENRTLEIEIPAELARYVARKGSITVSGVSLTVNEVDGALFRVNLIPHTLAVTTLKSLGAGARVNIEVDLIARYTERMMTFGSVDQWPANDSNSR